jgi:hypothetical protein
MISSRYAEAPALVAWRGDARDAGMKLDKDVQAVGRRQMPSNASCINSNNVTVSKQAVYINEPTPRRSEGNSQAL